MAKKNGLSSQFLKYNFTYEGQRYKGCIKLEDNASDVECLYYHHDLETTWGITIQHHGKRLVLTIVLADDYDDVANLGKVVASAFVCVYQIDNSFLCQHLVESFEPDFWEYINEADPSKNVNKETFYITDSDRI